MPFIPPMLAGRLTDPARLGGRAYMAEPKLDGQRAQLHVAGHRTTHIYSRPGRELLRHPGMAWLREVRWPFEAAVLDGEAVAGDGHGGIHAVFEERNKAGGDMALVVFDVLQVDGQSVMAEPWESRRKRLEDLLGGAAVPRVGIVPVTDNAAHLWDVWVGQGGEGIVLKEPTSRYSPGVRTPAWLKVKPKLTLEVVVMGGSDRRIAWGDWGEAVNLELAYTHPRTGAPTAIAQAVRVPKGESFELRGQARAEVVCWGVMPSGMLRHPVLRRWATD